MVPGKERTIARIPATSSSPAAEILPRRARESDTPSFGTLRPLVELKERPIIDPRYPNPTPGPKPVDRLSFNIVDKDMDYEAGVLFEIVRRIQPEAEKVPFHANHKGIFMGKKKIGHVIGSASESPEMRVWVDWLFRRRASNSNIILELPLPVLMDAFSIGEVTHFVSRLTSARYAAITADRFLVQLRLYASKTGPELASFNVRKAGPI